MSDLNSGELAKKFVKAVLQSFAKDRSEEVEVMHNATLREMLTLLSSWIGPTHKAYATEDQIPPRNLIYMAEVYARIAERTGQSETYKQFVPAGTLAEQDRKVITEQAPAFAKLAL